MFRKAANYILLYVSFSKKLPLTATGAEGETEYSVLKKEGHHLHQCAFPRGHLFQCPLS